MHIDVVIILVQAAKQRCAELQQLLQSEAAKVRKQEAAVINIDQALQESIKVCSL